MKTICIMCPMGCPLTVEEREGKLIVTGNTCKRGEGYGAAEYTNPRRVVTTLLKAKGWLYSVKTAKPVPKDKIFAVAAAVKAFSPPREYGIGEVLIPNVLETGADVLVTGRSPIID